MYSIKTDVVDKTILQQDEGIATSQRYLTRDSQSLIARLCYTLGFQNSKLGFYGLGPFHVLLGFLEGGTCLVSDMEKGAVVHVDCQPHIGVYIMRLLSSPQCCNSSTRW